MAVAKKKSETGVKRSSKNTAKKKTQAKKNTGTKKTASVKKNYLPVYIISGLLLTVLLSVFMYLNSDAGIISSFIKRILCGLFGVTAYALPVVILANTIYLSKTHNIRRFWLKFTLSILAMINVAAIIHLPSDTPLSDSYYWGSVYSSGGGVLGAAVAVFMDKMIQKIASAIILVFTFILLAGGITNINIIREIYVFSKKAFLGIHDKYEKFLDEHEEYYEDDYDNSEDICAPISNGRQKRETALEASDIFAEELNDRQKESEPIKEPFRKKKEKNVKPDNTSLFDDKNNLNFETGIDEVFKNLDENLPNAKVPKPMEMKDIPRPVNRQEKSAEIGTDFTENIVSEKSAAASPKDEPAAERVSKITKSEQSVFHDELNKAIDMPLIEYTFPSTKLLSEPKPITGDKREEMRRTAEKLINILANFNVKAKLLQVTQGPTVTRYEILPDSGIKLSKIVGLADDIALNLAVSTALVAPVPGKAAVGIDIPNSNVSTVSVRELLESDKFTNAKSKLTVVLGKDIGGNVVIGDIGKWPHVLIAGATGSGKSVCINTIITSILYKASPNDVKLIMVDPKVVELGVYNGIPHLLIPVVTDPKKAAGALNWAVSEMMRRYDLFKDTGVRKLESYNDLMEKEGGEKIPQLVIIIDELADLMMVASKEVEDYICRLAQLARAAGIHLIIATQRPSVDVITGLIKANIPSRIAFAVSSQVDSRTILDRGGAEKLLGWGDMLYSPSGSRTPTRVQGAFVSDDEIEKLLEFIKDNNEETHYSEDLAEHIERVSSGETGVTPDETDDGDELLHDAVSLAVELGKISTSMVQRRLGVGYARAGRIIDQMEARGIISGANGSKPRDVLVSRADMLNAVGADAGDYDEYEE